MKTCLTSTAVAAIVAIGISASANAACPNGASNYPGGVAGVVFATTGISYAVDTPTAEFLTGESYAPYDSDCHTPLGFGIGESTTGEIVDAGGGAGFYSHSPSITVGSNNSAFGNGSNVYTEETYTHPGADGILGNADDEQRTRIIPVSNGTAIGANSHVGHDHSTAVGADSETDRENQVVIGTKDDEVTVRNLTTNTADKADTTGIVVHKADGTLASDGGRIQGEIDANTAKNTAQDGMLTDHETRITSNTNRIGSLEAENAQQWNRINANSDAIAAHGVHLNELDKSVAIATAMPDAWLSDTKQFGVFGSVGGTGNETAIGFAAIGRIDETWSINGKLGADVEFDQFGWQVGAGAQW